MIKSTLIRNGNTRADQPAIHFDTNTVRHFYPSTNPITSGNWYEPPVNDSIIQGAGSAPGGQFTTSTTSATGRNELWRYNNRTNTARHTNTQAHTTRPSSHNGFHNNSLNSSDNRNGPTCFKCGEQGHMRMDCKERVFFCTHCRTANHDTKACRKYHSNAPSPTNSHIPGGYHPSATPPPLMGAATAIQQTQQTGATNNGPLFQNLFDNNQPRMSTAIHTPFNSASPAPSANMTEALTQIIAQVTQVTNNNKKDKVSKQMMKNIKIFDSTNKAECITWLSPIEAAARFTNTSFCGLIYQSMAPSMLHILSELSALTTDEDIKNAILTNYSDIPSTMEAAT